MFSAVPPIQEQHLISIDLFSLHFYLLPLFIYFHLPELCQFFLPMCE